MERVKAALTAALLSLAGLSSPAGAQDEPAGLPFKMVSVERASLEMPLPVDWVRLPAGDYSGVEAQFISVSDGAEMSVFSLPMQSAFGPQLVAERAQELRLMLAPTATWEEIDARAVRVDGHEGLALTALWPIPERPADVFALAVPVKGRTSVVFVMMARREGGKFAQIADMLERKTLVTRPPVDVPDRAAGTYSDGRGFSLDVPDGWRRILTEEVEQVALWAGVDPAESEPAETLGFARPGLYRQSPNVIVSIAESWMPVSEQMRQDFESQYRAIVGTRGSPFTLERTRIVEVAGRDSYLVTGTVEIVGASLDQSQYFVPLEEQSLIVTISIPSQLPPDHPVRAQAASFVDSLSISVPGAALDGPQDPEPVAEASADEASGPGSWRTPAIVVAILVVAAALILLLVRTGRRS